MLLTSIAILAILIVLLVFLFPELMRAVLVRTQSTRLAEAKAREMLRDVLAPEEMTHLLRHGYLSVPSRRNPGRVYHVPWRKGLVHVYEGEELVERLCVDTVVRVPDGDIVLMHKLMIEASEEEYLQVANHFSPRPLTYPF